MGGTPYAALYRHVLSLALEGGSTEAIGLVAEWPGEDEPVALVLYGWVPGAIRTGRVYFVAVTAAARLQGVGSRLMNVALQRLEREGARLVVAEGPNDASVRPAHILFRNCGFEDTARVPDFYRDGVDLIFLRRLAGQGACAEQPEAERPTAPRPR